MTDTVNNAIDNLTNDSTNDSTNSVMDSSAEDKQQLYDILTSDDYSEVKEITLPKQDDESLNWLQKLIEWLLDGDSNSSGSGSTDWLNIFSGFLKILAILALVLLVVWIVKNSDSIIDWVKNRSWKLGKRTVAIEDYRQAHLAQGWESLPPHEQIPAVVKQLLQEGRILPASSILYRGSLRWLNESDSQKTIIRPANTELQCVELIKQLRQSPSALNNQLNPRLNTGIPPATADYIINIITQWIPIAYQSSNQSISASSNETDNQQSNEKSEQAQYQQTQYQKALLSLANDWQRQLFNQASQQNEQQEQNA